MALKQPIVTDVEPLKTREINFVPLWKQNLNWSDDQILLVIIPPDFRIKKVDLGYHGKLKSCSMPQSRLYNLKKKNDTYNPTHLTPLVTCINQKVAATDLSCWCEGRVLGDGGDSQSYLRKPSYWGKDPLALSAQAAKRKWKWK